jgi:hypothetical protein
MSKLCRDEECVHTWEDNIRTDLKEVEFQDAD